MNWDQFLSAIDSQKITTFSALFKLLFAFIAGGVIGMNRERHKQPAGFRTHILICVGSTLLMMLSIYIPQTYFDFKNGDPGRIAAQVVSGIGFLGAGAIIRLGINIRGITTAASIWLISAIGLSIGAGLYTISLITIVIALFSLVILERIEHFWFPHMYLKNIYLEFADVNFPDTKIKAILKNAKITVSDYSIEIKNNGANITSFNIVVKVPEKANLSEVISSIHALPNITHLKIT